MKQLLSRPRSEKKVRMMRKCHQNKSTQNNNKSKFSKRTLTWMTMILIRRLRLWMNQEKTLNTSLLVSCFIWVPQMLAIIFHISISIVMKRMRNHQSGSRQRRRNGSNLMTLWSKNTASAILNKTASEETTLTTSSEKLWLITPRMPICWCMRNEGKSKSRSSFQRIISWRTNIF